MKILVWGEIKNGNAYDIFRRLDYRTIYNEFRNSCGANSQNVGNKVWIQGLVSTLSTQDNELYFYDKSETWEIINSKYDKIVYSAANMLSQDYEDLIKTISKLFCNSKIPVYVIAIGTQANSYDELDYIARETNEYVAEFMDVIYNTGGEIACRGYFTKEYLDKIANNSAVVTGCPSLFQAGRDLHITNKDEKIKPIFNGNAPFSNLAQKYINSVYIDQGEYLSYTYDFSDYDLCRLLANLIARKGEKNAKLFLQGRIKLFWDMSDWKNFVSSENFNFSIGSRIHGNIMSLLSGIPAVVFSIDSRTREMAEFYNIPTIDSLDDYNNIDSIYRNLDYSKFNERFPKLFDAYEEFLKGCGLVNSIERSEEFLDRKLPLNNVYPYEKISNLYERYVDSSLLEKIYYKIARIFPEFAKIKELEQISIIEKYEN